MLRKTGDVFLRAGNTSLKLLRGTIMVAGTITLGGLGIAGYALLNSGSDSDSRFSLGGILEPSDVSIERPEKMRYLQTNLNSKNPVVSVIRLTGVIMAGEGSGYLNIETCGKQIQKAFDVPNVKAVCVIINCPGGSPVQSYLIYDRIRQLSIKKNVKVYTFAEDLAASGGYILACAGDVIYAHQSSLVGSIGVVSSGFGFHELMKSWNVERRLYTAGTNKARLDSFSAEKEEDRLWLQELLDESHKDFIELVKTRRADKFGENPDESVLFSGDVWTGRNAKKLGLIDSFGEYRSAMQSIFGDEVQFVSIRAKSSLIANLFGSAFHVLQSRNGFSRYGL